MPSTFETSVNDKFILHFGSKPEGELSVYGMLTLDPEREERFTSHYLFFPVDRHHHLCWSPASNGTTLVIPSLPPFFLDAQTEIEKPKSINRPSAILQAVLAYAITQKWRIHHANIFVGSTLFQAPFLYSDAALLFAFARLLVPAIFTVRLNVESIDHLDRIAAMVLSPRPPRAIWYALDSSRPTSVFYSHPRWHIETYPKEAISSYAWMLVKPKQSGLLEEMPTITPMLDDLSAYYPQINQGMFDEWQIGQDETHLKARYGMNRLVVAKAIIRQQKLTAQLAILLQKKEKELLKTMMEGYFQDKQNTLQALDVEPWNQKIGKVISAMARFDENLSWFPFPVSSTMYFLAFVSKTQLPRLTRALSSYFFDDQCLVLKPRR